jgi:uncharacterized membrane protein YeaQ/YmgE (transglycosylase-associated protein family)
VVIVLVVTRNKLPSSNQTGESEMPLLTWIILGLVAGFFASHLVNHRGEGMVLDILLGIVGAIVGGWVLHQFGYASVNGLNLYSILVAIGGAAVLLIVYHAIRRQRRRIF